MKANGSQILGIPARPAQCSDYLFRTLPRCTVVCTLVRSGLASRRRGSTGTQVSNGGGGAPPKSPLFGAKSKGFCPGSWSWADVGRGGSNAPPLSHRSGTKAGCWLGSARSLIQPQGWVSLQPPPTGNGVGGGLYQLHHLQHVPFSFRKRI